MASNITMHFYVASESTYGLCLIMCNEMAPGEVFPELRNSTIHVVLYFWQEGQQLASLKRQVF